MSVEFNWEKNQFNYLLASTSKNIILPFVDKYINKSSYVLEAGCGMGHIVKYLQNEGYNIIGIELSKNAVDAGLEFLDSNSIINADVEKIPFPDNTFDHIISLGVVEHIIEGPNKALQEMYRVLKPGGSIIFTVPIENILRKLKRFTGIYYLEHFVRYIYKRFVKKEESWLEKLPQQPKKILSALQWPFIGNFFEYRYSYNQIRRFIQDAGFEIELEVPLDGLGGLYHEFSVKLINLDNPNNFVKFMDNIFSKVPFFHHHTYLAILKKNKK